MLPLLLLATALVAPSAMQSAASGVDYPLVCEYKNSLYQQTPRPRKRPKRRTRRNTGIVNGAVVPIQVDDDDSPSFARFRMSPKMPSSSEPMRARLEMLSDTAVRVSAPVPAAINYRGTVHVTEIDVPFKAFDPEEARLREHRSDSSFVSVTWPHREIIEQISYPEAEQAKGMEGEIIASVHVDSAGTATEMRLVTLHGVGKSFEQQVREGIERTHFTPARLRSQSVESWIDVQVSFTIR